MEIYDEEIAIWFISKYWSFLLIYQGCHFHVTLFGAGEERHREESLTGFESWNLKF